MTYSVSDPVPGTLTVRIKGGKLRGMDVTPTSPVEKGRIIEIFGSGYRIVHYDSEDCLNQGGSAPVYQSPNGPIEHMEYPALGIAVNIHDGKADTIAYTSHPAGPAHPICIARK